MIANELQSINKFLIERNDLKRMEVSFDNKEAKNP